MNRKILFITPPYHCGVVEVAGSWVPLTFVYLAGAVRTAGYEPVIYDAMTKRHGFPEIRERIEAEKPAYVATSAITSTAPDALEILRIAKELDPAIVTLIGGVHPTFLYEEILRDNPFVDIVVRGEGEETLPELLRALEKGDGLPGVQGIAYREGPLVRATEGRPFIQDLDRLATAWDLVDWRDYRYYVIPGSRLGAVSTSRGCSHNCTFCSQQKFWHQVWRPRRPENVVAEIESLFRDHGVNVFLLPDEYPTSDRERWEQFLDLLIEKDLGIHLLMETRAEDILRDRDILWKYRRAGIVHIYIGVEATDQDTLDLIKKDIRVETGVEAIRLIHAHGMITETSFILGFPHETRESIARTLKLSKVYNPDFAHYLALAPWPYADMYGELEPHIAVRDYRKYNLIDPVIKPEAMELEDIDRAIIDCYQKFYMGKLREIVTLKDEFKRRYILHSMKLIMNSSFIVEKLGTLGAMPPQVKALIEKLEGGPHREPEVDDEAAQTDVVCRSVRVDRPVADVFDFISDPTHWPEFIPGLASIRNLSDRPTHVGTRFDWSYRIGGIPVSGTGRVTKKEGQSLFALEMHPFFPLAEQFRLRSTHGATVLTVEIGRRTAGKILSIFFRRAMKNVTVKEADRVLARIKAICEDAGETRCRKEA